MIYIYISFIKTRANVSNKKKSTISRTIRHVFIIILIIATLRFLSRLSLSVCLSSYETVLFLQYIV